eukprot:403331490
MNQKSVGNNNPMQPNKIEQMYANTSNSRPLNNNQSNNYGNGSTNNRGRGGANNRGGYGNTNQQGLFNRNQVKVNKKQETNPLLKYSRFQYILVDDQNPQHQTSPMFEDYDINEKVSLLFLQLSYHIAYPLYIIQRLEDIYRHRKTRNKMLLVLNDDKDDQNMINGLLMECIKFETKMIMCWSFEEAAQYIQTFKSYENKTQTMLEGKYQNQGNTHLEQATDVLGSIRRVNKTDAKNLLCNFGSIEQVILAPSYEEFLNMDGIGQSKIDAITQCFRGKFVNYKGQPVGSGGQVSNQISAASDVSKKLLLQEGEDQVKSDSKLQKEQDLEESKEQIKEKE